MEGADGGRPLRGSGALGLGLVLLLLLLAPPRVAADDGEIVLADHSLWSVTSDLDGDGAREVVAVRGAGNDPDARTEYLVQAWAFRAGTWVSLGTAPFLRWDGGVDPVLRPARVGAQDSVGLLVVSRDGAPAVLAASAIADENEQRSGGCCLSLAWIELRDDRIRVMPVERDLGPAESLSVLDVDGDGTDELFVTEQTVFDEVGPPASTYALLRQAGGGFEREPIALPEETAIYVAAIGNTDGVAGDDLVLVGQRENTLLRVADDEGRLRVESADAEGLFDWQLGGWFAGAAGGRLITVEDEGMSLIRWPRGRLPTSVGSIETAQFPSVFVLGEGADARLVELAGTSGAGGEPLGIRIYDLELRLERYLPAPQLLNEVWAMTNQYSGPPLEPLGYVYPQVGPVPGGIDGRDALLGYGSLVVIEPDGSLRVQAAAPMVSTGIVGAVGPGDGWLLSGPEWFGGAGANAYLGSMGGEPPRSDLRVLPLATVLDPSGARDPEITVQGATEIGTGVDRRLVAPEGGFQVTVAGAVGTVVVVSAGRELQAEEITEGPVTLTLDPGGRDDRNRPFEASVLVVRASGIASGARWDAEILREAPELTANTLAEPFALRTTVFGRASSGARVTVDGQPVETNRNGAYRVEVDAPVWPREVLVVARDPVGNETVELLEVIGFVDYRGLPWIPIIAVLTVTSGVVLFLRTPRIRPQPVLVPDGDGRLEEIDGDPF
ncbi:MAG TPA: hypothetical protein VF365_09935 [Candidatus Limnocylindria bacterium]